jgi:hypothetical protein
MAALTDYKTVTLVGLGAVILVLLSLGENGETAKRNITFTRFVNAHQPGFVRGI